MHHQNDSTWVKSRLWMTTEHLPGTRLPLLSADHGFSTFGRNTYSSFTLYHSATNHRTDHLRLFLLAPFVQDSLNHFCWWASQTVYKWTRPCVRGDRWDCSPARLVLAAHFHCAMISSTASQRVCWDLPRAAYFSCHFSPSVLFFLLFPPIRAKGLTGAIMKRVNG